MRIEFISFKVPGLLLLKVGRFDSLDGDGPAREAWVVEVVTCRLTHFYPHFYPHCCLE